MFDDEDMRNYMPIGSPSGVRASNSARRAREQVEVAKQAYLSAQQRLDRIEAIENRWGGEPEIGSVLMVGKTFDNDDRVFQFVLIRVDNGRNKHWYHTGGNTGHVGGLSKEPMTWEAVKQFIGEDQVWIADGWVEMGVDTQRTFLVREVADMLKCTPQTLRRFLREQGYKTEAGGVYRITPEQSNIISQTFDIWANGGEPADDESGNDPV